MEGWKEIEISNKLDSGIIKKIRTCGRCIYYQHRLLRSGRSPIYANLCTHKDAKLSTGSIYSGNLNQNLHGYVEPADWCPFTESIERELKINKIINEK